MDAESAQSRPHAKFNVRGHVEFTASTKPSSTTTTTATIAAGNAMSPSRALGQKQSKQHQRHQRQQNQESIYGGMQEETGSTNNYNSSNLNIIIEYMDVDCGGVTNERTSATHQYRMLRSNNDNFNYDSGTGFVVGAKAVINASSAAVRAAGKPSVPPPIVPTPRVLYSDAQLDRLAKLFVRIVDIKNRRYRFKAYTNCFVGREAVDKMISDMQIPTRADAVELGNIFFSKELFVHVTGQHVFKDEYLFYRLNHDAVQVLLSSSLSNIRTRSISSPPPPPLPLPPPGTPTSNSSNHAIISDKNSNNNNKYSLLPQKLVKMRFTNLITGGFISSDAMDAAEDETCDAFRSMLRSRSHPDRSQLSSQSADNQARLTAARLNTMVKRVQKEMINVRFVSMQLNRGCLCTICGHMPVDTCFVPCGHADLCKRCAGVALTTVTNAANDLGARHAPEFSVSHTSWATVAGFLGKNESRYNSVVQECPLCNMHIDRVISIFENDLRPGTKRQPDTHASNF